MLYIINNKYYILVSGYYKEVIVKVNPADKSDYIVEVVKNGKKIEADDRHIVAQISVKDAYMAIKNNRFEND